MNSLGVSPYVNWMYSDLADGLIIFQLYDIIKPGVVTWPKVHKKFNRMKKFMEKLENCNYVVDLGRKQKFSLVGIAGMVPAVNLALYATDWAVVLHTSCTVHNSGQDICDGNATLTLALVWQLMRAYTLALLSQLNSDNTPIVESEIIAWANNKLEQKGVTIRHFQDKVIYTINNFVPVVQWFL